MSNSQPVSVPEVPEVPEPIAPVAVPCVKEDVRARLLRAAMEVLRNEGIQALTQVHVAGVAGVRQSHLTYYFPTRHSLLAAIVDEGAEVAVCCLGRSDASELPATVQLYLSGIATQISDAALSRIMMALAQSSEEDASLKGWMADFRQRKIERLRASLLHYGVVATDDQLSLFHTQLVGLSVINLSEATPAAAQEAHRLCLLAGEQLLAQAARGPAPARPSINGQSTQAGVTHPHV